MIIEKKGAKYDEANVLVDIETGKKNAIIASKLNGFLAFVVWWKCNRFTWFSMTSAPNDPENQW